MITEDYVNFEIAKLLKEKGFDVCCMAVYSLQGQFNNPASIFSLKNNEFIYAPTLQMAMKWLREERKINIEIITYWTKDKSMVYGNRIVYNDAVLKEIDTAYNSYEEACETAIKYCLKNLI